VHNQKPECCRERQRSRSRSEENRSHWSSLPGSVPTVKSLLTKAMIAAANSEMSDWYMAVIEEIEEDSARGRGIMLWSSQHDAQKFLDDFATQMYIKSRRGIDNLGEDN